MSDAGCEGSTPRREPRRRAVAGNHTATHEESARQKPSTKLLKKPRATGAAGGAGSMRGDLGGEGVADEVHFVLAHPSVERQRDH